MADDSKDPKPCLVPSKRRQISARQHGISQKTALGRVHVVQDVEFLRKLDLVSCRLIINGLERRGEKPSLTF
jgi:hypothetical protein